MSHGAATPPDFKRVVVVGAGAVGGYFGGLLARAGVQVTLIGRPGFVEAVNTRGLRMETHTFTETVQVNASTELHPVSDADLVLLCVKTPDSRSASEAIAPYLSSDTTLLSLQNGVDNVSILRRATTASSVLPAVVYLAASVPEPGTVRHTGRGDLIIGPPGVETSRIQKLFRRAAVDCRVTEHIDDEMWEKFICNCALNALSAIAQKTYGEISQHPECWHVATAAIREALQVARARGISPTRMSDVPTATDTVFQLTRQISGALSSTAQDLRNHRRTEIDSLNGFIARQGHELGIPVPVNETLHALVKFLESQPTPVPR